MTIRMQALIPKTRKSELKHLHIVEGVLDVYLKFPGIERHDIDRAEIIRLIEGKFLEGAKAKLQGIVSFFLINDAIPNSNKIAYLRQKI